MSYKAIDPCIQKAFDDEMLFVLMARDATAPQVIMEWVKLNLHIQPAEKLNEAMNCAKIMIDTCAKMNFRKAQLKRHDKLVAKIKNKPIAWLGPDYNTDGSFSPCIGCNLECTKNSDCYIHYP